MIVRFANIFIAISLEIVSIQLTTPIKRDIPENTLLCDLPVAPPRSDEFRLVQIDARLALFEPYNMN